MSDTVIVDESGWSQLDHASVKIEAEPLEIELDPIALNAGPARANASAVRNGIRNISQQGHGHRAFNATGTLANGIDAVREGDDWNICAPSGRLDGTNGDQLTQELIDLVPAIDNPLGDPEVAVAIVEAADLAVKIGKRRR